MFQEALVTPLGPTTKTTTKTQPARKDKPLTKPSKPTPNKPRTDQ
jgi:hypothetical protein